MAPKQPRAKPTKKEKTEVEKMSEPRHNMVVFLDPENKLAIDYGGNMEFLRRSRIAHATSQEHTSYITLIKAFWESTSVQKVNNEEVIHAKINEQDVTVFEHVIRIVLRFEDTRADPTTISTRCQQGCLLRIKCNGDNLAGQLNQETLPLQYKFFLHVLIQCLCTRRVGCDMANSSLLGLMTVLTLNKSFNISCFILYNMKENLGRRGGNLTKFWMYPIFVQMIKDSQLPNLPKDEKDVLKIDVMMQHSLVMFKKMSKYTESTPRCLDF
ncbi:hypothetical protein Hanom_Chr03g00183651 [Helianthus anomalus]